MPFPRSLSEAPGLHRYRFLSTWHLPTPARCVYEVLADPLTYPRWWPQFQEVRQIDERAVVMTVRSLLPFELTFMVHEERRDPAAGVLEARLEGDLEGVTRWTVTEHCEGTAIAQFFEHVEARKPLLRRLALPAKPVFRFNHALLMRHGRNGLRHHLALHP